MWHGFVAECAGATKQFDQNSLVHAIWKYLAMLDVEVWVARVPTDDNIADLPSREDYSLLRLLRAVRVEPVFHHLFLDAQSWDALSVLGLM